MTGKKNILEEEAGTGSLPRDWRHRSWSAGIGLWDGKPMLWVGRIWYDRYYYVAHLGPLWIEYKG